MTTPFMYKDVGHKVAILIDKGMTIVIITGPQGGKSYMGHGNF